MSKTTYPIYSSFNSVEEALAAITDLTGDSKGVVNAVKAFQNHLIGQVVTFGSEGLLPSGYRFKTSKWLVHWLEQKGFVSVSDVYVLPDNKNRPIGVLGTGGSRHYLKFEYAGPVDVAEELIELAKKHTAYYEAADKLQYFEVTSIDRDGDAIISARDLPTNTVMNASYYPYLEGGIVALIEDFMASDESVLILAGPPGTGKTTGIRHSAVNLGLAPIVTSSAEVMHNPKFINAIFERYDSEIKSYFNKLEKVPEFVMEENHFWETRNPERLASDAILNSNKIVEGPGITTPDVGRDFVVSTMLSFTGRMSYESIMSGGYASSETGRLPVLVIEDADGLMGKRTDGNLLMQNLLNKTDGLGRTVPAKLILTTNLGTTETVDEALLRPGRCYGFHPFLKLTPSQAIVARRDAGLPPFDVEPQEDISLAEALRAPRKRIFKDAKLGVMKMMH